jgi:DNA-binding NarL/FixJ family response regulator
MLLVIKRLISDLMLLSLDHVLSVECDQVPELLLLFALVRGRCLRSPASVQRPHFNPSASLMNNVATLARTIQRPFGDASAIRVYAACGDTIFRRGIAAVLAEEGGFSWAGEASSGSQAIDESPGLAPDVVIIDAELPGLPALATLQALRQLLPRTRFAVLFSELEPDAVRAAVAAGAACVLSKSATQGEMIAALQAVYRGVWAHSPAVTQVLTAPRTAPAAPARLTPRERDLLELMAQGLTNSDISRRLAIAMPTVKFHVGHIMSKLGAENRTAAVLAGLRHKLVALDPADRPLAPGSAD